jgi:peptide/nickel transport system permease protein
VGRFLGQRAGLAIPTILVVATITFFLMQLIPSSPASFLLGSGATQEQVTHLTHQLGLDRPVLVQYGSWISQAVRGDFGDSFVSGTSARSSVMKALPVTLSLALLTLVMTIVLGVALGMAAAVRGGWLDRVIQSLSSLAMAVPSFWLGVLLVWVLAIEVKFFYATGYAPLSAGPQEWALHLFLPALALTVGATGQIMYQTRAAALEVLGRDYIRTLQAAGLSRRRIIFKHVLRNAAIPVTTVLGMTFVFLLGGVVVIEMIFALPGMGYLMLQAVNSHDLAVAQAGVVAFTILVILVNLFTDMVTVWLDPRARRQ